MYFFGNIYFFIIISFFILFLSYRMYSKENMKIIKNDENDILKQELSEVEKELSNSGEYNVLSEQDKDLGQTFQLQPEI